MSMVSFLIAVCMVGSGVTGPVSQAPASTGTATGAAPAAGAADTAPRP